MPNRLVVPDLNKANIQPAVRQSDSFEYVHGVNQNLTDWSALSKSLVGALAGFTDLYGDKQNKMGEADFAKSLSDAEAELGDSQAAFAKAVSKGQLPEAHNPFYQAGYLKALGHEVAGRMHTQASPAISHGILLDGEPNPVTGVAPIAQTSPGSYVTQGTHKVQMWEYPDGKQVPNKPP